MKNLFISILLSFSINSFSQNIVDNKGRVIYHIDGDKLYDNKGKVVQQRVGDKVIDSRGRVLYKSNKDIFIVK